MGGYSHGYDGNTEAYQECYSGGVRDQMTIFIPVTAAGSSNWTSKSENVGGTETTCFNGIDYVQFSLNISKSYPSAITTFQTSYDTGINVSSTYDKPVNITQVGWDTLWYLLGYLPYGMGQVVSTFNYEHSLYSSAGLGSNPSDQYDGSGNDTQIIFGMDSGKTQTGCCIGSSDTNKRWGYDTYGSETVYEITIMSKNFLNASKLIIGAQNIEQFDSNGLIATSNGSYSNVSINVVPANTLSGSVTNYGKPLPDQQIIISQTYNGTTTDFYEHTNSSGDYRFFAEPGSSYTLEVDTGDGSIQSSNTVETSGYGSTSLNLNMDSPGTVTFHESGLSSGTTWSVTLNGVTDSTISGTISGTISFSEPFGTYSYCIGSISGYFISPQSGSIVLNSFSYSKDITFTSVGPVTFHESGLPSGTSWEAYVGSYSGSGTGTSLTVTAPTGTYSYSIPNVDVKMSNGDTDVYSANPSGGTVSTGGSVSTTFSLSEVISPPSGGGGGGGGTGCVNGTTEILLANGTYTKAQDLNIVGSYVMTYNLTTHSYHAEKVKDLYITHLHRQYDINGMLNVSGYQPILTNHGYVTAQNLTIRDMMYNAFTRSFVQITSITVTHGYFTMYDFNIPPDYDFIAGQFVVYDATIQP